MNDTEKYIFFTGKFIEKDNNKCKHRNSRLMGSGTSKDIRVGLFYCDDCGEEFEYDIGAWEDEKAYLNLISQESSNDE